MLARSHTVTASPFRIVTTVLIAVAALLLGSQGTRAESTATRVILSHVPVISNWGPETANGVVVFSLDEGDVRADLVGLPVLDASQVYELWLVNSTSGERYSTVRFNAAADGQVTYIDQLLPQAIPDNGWDQVQITVEPEPDADPAPSGQIAIVGGVAGTSAEVAQFPPILPETGIADRHDGGVMALGIAAAAVVFLGLAVRGIRLKRGGAA
jgi:hypothetical protein